MDANAGSQVARPGEGASTRLDFTIRIPALLRLRTLAAVRSVELPAEGQRVVDVQDAATFEVQSNLRAGYELRFEIHDPQVEAVEIAGLDHPVSVSRSGESVRFWRVANPDATRRHSLRYKIRYAPGTRAGARAMPVSFSVSPGA